MKKVLIYGLYDWNNLGDDLMMYAINDKINAYGKVEPFFIKSNNENYFDFDRKYDSNLFLNKKYNLKIINKIVQYLEVLKLGLRKNLEYDALIFMGGGYINRSIGSGYGRLIYILLLKIMFKARNKKVYFTGQTTGPIQNGFDKFLFRNIYKNCSIFVREEYSFSLLRTIGIKSKLVGDDAFLCNNAVETRGETEKYIIVNYKDFYNYHNVIDNYVKMINEVYIKKRIKVVLLPFRNGDRYSEYLLHQKIYEKLKRCGVNVELRKTNNVNDILKLFSNCEFVIATAYHAVLLGLMNNKKVYTGYIGEYYKIKIQGITNFYDSSMYSSYNLLDNLAFDKLYENILESQENKKSLIEINSQLKCKVNNEWDIIIKEIMNG